MLKETTQFVTGALQGARLIGEYASKKSARKALARAKTKDPRAEVFAAAEWLEKLQEQLTPKPPVAKKKTTKKTAASKKPAVKKIVKKPTVKKTAVKKTAVKKSAEPLMLRPGSNQEKVFQQFFANNTKPVPSADIYEWMAKNDIKPCLYNMLARISQFDYRFKNDRRKHTLTVTKRSS